MSNSTIHQGYITSRMAVDADLALLEKAQALMEVERSLTATLEKVEPWLLANTSKTGSNNDHFGKRVRPIPTTMDQVRQVLAVSRNYSPRTSAPAGWNPNAPVVGFSTPNPLPHQLRGGALAALQLDRARQSERDKKRRREAEEEEQKAAKKLQEAQAMDVDKNVTDKREPTNRPQGAPSQAGAGAAAARPRPANRPQQQVLTTTMNLSDSSSSEEEEDDSE